MLREDISKALSIDVQTLREYETGARSIPADVLSDLSGVLHKDPSWFLDVTSGLNEEADQPQGAASEFDECVSLLIKLKDRSELGLVKGMLRLAVANLD